MARLSLTIEDDLLRRARARALQQGTSINALVREYLASLAGRSEVPDAISKLLELSRKARCGSGDRGHSWTRDEIHER